MDKFKQKFLYNKASKISYNKVKVPTLIPTLNILKQSAPKIEYPHIIIRYKTLKIMYIFKHKHDLNMYYKLLPYIKRYLHIEIENSTNFDICIAIYVDENDLEILNNNLKKPLMILHGEPNRVFNTDIAQFVQSDIKKDHIYHCPTMCIWSTPSECQKTRLCSAIDSGKRKWRKLLIEKINQQIDIDLYGVGYGNPINGYHGGTPEKEVGLKDYMFSIGVEHQKITDYITEKYNDIILNECIPIYNGPSNINDFFLPCHIDIDNICYRHINYDFYIKNYSNIIENKKRILSKYNIFSYFCLIFYNDLLCERPLL